MALPSRRARFVPQQMCLRKDSIRIGLDSVREAARAREGAGRERYRAERGRKTVTLWSRRTSAFGSAADTSASPPVFAKGAISEVQYAMCSGEPMFNQLE